jgi:UDP-2,3-diacylglucosamine pyrophosphatase LpxH
MLEERSMPIAVISDLHRGPIERLAQSPLIESFLDFARFHGWKLIYLGDIVDLWKVTYEEAMDVDGTMIEMLAKYPDYLWVPGNHDGDVETMRKIFKLDGGVKEYVRIGDRLCFHGHQLDSLLDSDYERAGTAFLDRIGYDLREFGPLNAIRAMIDQAHRNNRELDFRSRSWGDVLTGHTHLAAVTDDGRFMNDGTWNGEELPHYVLFDGETIPALMEWSGEAKEPA